MEGLFEVTLPRRHKTTGQHSYGDQYVQPSQFNNTLQNANQTLEKCDPYAVQLRMASTSAQYLSTIGDVTLVLSC
jgi:hypothetical protein